MMSKLGGSELSGLILKLRTRCKMMRNINPVEYGQEILMYECIIKHLMELQRYRVSMRKAEELSDIRSDS